MGWLRKTYHDKILVDTRIMKKRLHFLYISDKEIKKEIEKTTKGYIFLPYITREMSKKIFYKLLEKDRQRRRKIKLKNRREHSKLTNKLREKIKKKFNYKCQVCGGIGEHIHHIKPIIEGGKTVNNNLILLCKDCHAVIHNRSGPNIKKWKKIIDKYEVTEDEYNKKWIKYEITEEFKNRQKLIKNKLGLH